MSIKDGIKNVALGTAKVIGSVALGTVGAASAIIEEAGAATGVEPIKGVGHGLKSISFNGVRKMWGKEPIEHKKRDGHVMIQEIERTKSRCESHMRYQENYEDQ